MQPRKTQAIILRRTNYGEADRIINFLTPEGKVNAIAKGVRRPKSKLAGGLELFAISDITIMEGRGELGLVTSARMQTFFGDILHDYDRMQLGYEIIKRINRATETVSEPEFYALLRDSLGYLASLHIPLQLIEIWFNLRLAALLGSGMNLVTDIEGHKLQHDSRYFYDENEHSFYTHTKGTFAAEHIKLLRLASVKTPDVLSHVGGVGAILGDCRALTAHLQ